MNRKLHIQTAKGAVNIVNSSDYQTLIETLNIHDPEWRLLTGSQCWLAAARPTIERLSKQLIFSSLDIMGLPRFEVPAEWVAAVGISFISESNYLHWASWLGSFARAEDLGNYDGARKGLIEGLEKCTSAQIFALMCELRSDENLMLLNRRFTDKVATALQIEPEVKDEKKKQ